MAKMTLDDLIAQLRGAHADLLSAIVLYGSAAGRDEPAVHADRNVLVVVSSITLETMRAAGAVARAWTEAGNPAPMTLTNAEWRSSTDVFAMEHADIRARHRVLFVAPGFELFAGPPPSTRDIRQQLEYEAMATLLGVRSRVLESTGSLKEREALLTGSVRRVLALFRALLRLAGELPDDDADAVCRAAARVAEFSPEPFLAVLAHRRGRARLTNSTVGDVLTGFHAGLARVVAFLDAMPIED